MPGRRVSNAGQTVLVHEHVVTKLRRTVLERKQTVIVRDQAVSVSMQTVIVHEQLVAKPLQAVSELAQLVTRLVQDDIDLWFVHFSPTPVHNCLRPADIRVWESGVRKLDVGH